MHNNSFQQFPLKFFYPVLYNSTVFYLIAHCTNVMCVMPIFYNILCAQIHEIRSRNLAGRIDNPVKGGSCLNCDGSLKVLVPTAMAQLLSCKLLSALPYLLG